MNFFKAISASLLTLAAIPAFAADLERPVSRMPAYAPSISIWNGFYLGIHGGYGWGQIGETNFNVFSTDIDGGFVGGQIGVNFQIPNTSWVFGIEADAAWASIGASETLLLGGVPIATGSSTINAIGTVRGRVGYSFGPTLVYGTGGFAWANNELSGSALGVTISDEQFHTGWTVGGGLEWAFGRNWSAKIEYLYMDFSSQTYFANILGGVSGDGHLHTIKGGINYRFDWGGHRMARN